MSGEVQHENIQAVDNDLSAPARAHLRTGLGEWTEAILPWMHNWGFQ
jgi:hypothetical protein